MTDNHHDPVAAMVEATRKLETGRTNGVSAFGQMVEPPDDEFPDEDTFTVNVEPHMVEEDGSSWDEIDMRAIGEAILADTYVEERPDVVMVPGTESGLFYRGKVNSIHGIGGVGKSMVAVLGIAEQLAAGRQVVWIDFEDTPATIMYRLLRVVGLPLEVVLAGLHYFRPDERTRPGIDRVINLMRSVEVTLAIVDSTGEAHAVDGIKANDDIEVALWMRMVPRRMADAGAAVVLIDHVPKADEEALSPIGSQRKFAAINGVTYSVVCKTSFSKSKSGRSRIICGKDRLGTYARGQAVADLVVDVVGETSTFRLDRPDNAIDDQGELRPTQAMEAASRWVETNGPKCSGNAIAKGIGRNRELVTTVLRILVDEGFFTREEVGKAQFHTSSRAYRAAHDTTYRAIS